MDLKLFLGVSVDTTIFGGRDPSSEELDALLDEASEQLAQHLWPTVVALASPLRQVHATCGLYERTDTSAPRARLRRQGEQLELELTVDWRPLLDRPVLDQALFLLEHMQAAIATALEAKQQRTLADACRAFRPALDLQRAVAKRAAWVAEWLEQSPTDSIALAPDPDGRIRRIQPLTRRRGTLWLMLRQPGDLDEAGTNALLDRIEAHAAEHGVGRSDGRSFGAGSIDISFKVRNLQEAAANLDAFLRRDCPACDYVLSDDFEVVFTTPD
ncbi:hypothetical protein [Lysobacter solisilvae (ex Woo and Kim 2020)]|uniref:Uncharacterized protein n=1 Tax=Agrilutibacter terrestris TaxID=2865112 RepID=A0A7H0FZW2_9GAMM|nr:hypothetical protein [Lysobacter terrestris]QNP41578.1 hypothetical protein H8B22_05050 [Lysobacter terrestris]